MELRLLDWVVDRINLPKILSIYLSLLIYFCNWVRHFRAFGLGEFLHIAVTTINSNKTTTHKLFIVTNSIRYCLEHAMTATWRSTPINGCPIQINRYFPSYISCLSSWCIYIYAMNFTEWQSGGFLYHDQGSRKHMDLKQFT